MEREWVEAFDLIDGDDEVRAVVVTGRGRAFCDGADLSRRAAGFDVLRRARERATETRFRSRTSPRRFARRWIRAHR